jgi:hypothetical protein
MRPFTPIGIRYALLHRRNKEIPGRARFLRQRLLPMSETRFTAGDRPA